MRTYVHCSSVSWTKKDLVTWFYILPGLTWFPALLTHNYTIAEVCSMDTDKYDNKRLSVHAQITSHGYKCRISRYQ